MLFCIQSTHGSGRRVRSRPSAVFMVSLEFLPHEVKVLTTPFFALYPYTLISLSGNALKPIQRKG